MVSLHENGGQIFIQAERTGDLNLHLVALHGMLPYFAAHGHHLFTKSVHLYIQQMISLPVDHPNVYSMLLKGAMLYAKVTDTGQVCHNLASVDAQRKINGRLTRGWGVTEVQRSVCNKSLPACSQINRTMQDFTGTTYHTSEQHVEASHARVKTDREDTEKITSKEEHISFKNETRKTNSASFTCSVKS